MGVTIYYRGKLNEMRALGALVDELEEFAQSLGWHTQRCGGDRSRPNTARISIRKERIAITGNLPLQGITILPHENCEPLWLSFDTHGYLADPVGTSIVDQGTKDQGKTWLSTKTQFTPPRIHAAIIKLLQYLKKRYISDLEVQDDGGYWESGDIHELERRIDSINHALDVLEGALSSHDYGRTKPSPPEDLLQIVERILKEKFRG
jgi:hypothetical protein